MVYTLTIPVIRFIEFNTSEIADPSGNRHIPGGSFAFKQDIALGCRKYTGVGTSGTLVFENLKFDTINPRSHLESKVTAIVVALASSGIGIADMRLWLKEDSALQYSKDSGLDEAFVQIAPSSTWQPNCLLPSGAGTRLTRTVPTLPNIRRWDGGTALLRIADSDVSQYIYCNLVAPYGGRQRQYGVCGSGLLRFNFAFSYFFT